MHPVLVQVVSECPLAMAMRVAANCTENLDTQVLDSADLPLIIIVIVSYVLI